MSAAYQNIWQNIWQNIRVILIVLAWLAAIVQVMAGDAATGLLSEGLTGAAYLFGLYILMSLPMINRGSVMIIAFLGLLGALILPEVTRDDLEAAGRYILIFAGLVATMILAKTTAQTMPSVRRTQDALAQLPNEKRAVGLQLAGHAFGGVINTGAFAMLSAALPRNADHLSRVKAAQAALRGMNSSVVWSPFFVSFAVGQVFIDARSAWIAIGIGVFTSLFFMMVTLPIFTPKLSRTVIKASLACLKPVSIRLIFVLISVLAAALIFDLTALSAVVVVMPVIILIQFVRQPQNVKEILTLTRSALTQVADDIVVISAAMILGFLVTSTDAIAPFLAMMPVDVVHGAIALIATPVVMCLASFIGVHPVISSTFLLALFSGGGADVSPALLMQAHMIGWGAGTMSSLASLSVISCSTLYQVSTRELALGANAYAALGFATVGGVMLSLINVFF